VVAEEGLEPPTRGL